MSPTSAAPSPPFLCAPKAGAMLNVLGMPTRVIAGGSDTGGAYALFDTLCPPGVGVPLHVHSREDETFIGLEGALTLVIDKKQHTLTPGVVAFAPRGVPHRFLNESGRPCRYYVLTTPSGFERFFAELDRDLPPSKPFDEAKFGRIMQAYGLAVVS